MGDRPSILRRLGPAGVLGILWGTLPAIGGITLLAQLGPLSEWLRAHGGVGLAVYVAAFVVAAGFGLLPTYSQAVLAGWVYGVSVGLPAALAGFAGASIVGFAITRLVARNRVEQVIAENPKAVAIRQALVGRGLLRTLGIVTLLRVPPNSPFALTNLVMAGSGVALIPYAIGTFIGLTPRTGIAVFFAAAAARTGAKDIQTFVKDGLGLGVFLAGLAVMIIVLAIIGTIANRAIDRVVGETPPKENGTSAT